MPWQWTSIEAPSLNRESKSWQLCKTCISGWAFGSFMNFHCAHKFFSYVPAPHVLHYPLFSFILQFSALQRSMSDSTAEFATFEQLFLGNPDIIKTKNISISLPVRFQSCWVFLRCFRTDQQVCHSKLKSGAKSLQLSIAFLFVHHRQCSKWLLAVVFSLFLPYC